MPKCFQCGISWIESVKVCPKCKISIVPVASEHWTTSAQDSDEINDITSWKDKHFDVFTSGHKDNSGEWEEEFFVNFYNKWMKGLEEFPEGSYSEWELLDFASKKTQEIVKAIKEVENIIKDGINTDFHDSLDFSQANPKPVSPTSSEYPTEPEKPIVDECTPLLNLLDHLYPKWRLAKEREGKIIFDQAMEAELSNHQYHHHD